MNPPFHLDAVSIAFYLAYAFLLYAISLVVYRLYFHPLSQFPGRNLAAASKWYEFYFDVLKSQGGQYSEHVNHLHDRYGPILRINPDELHIRDSSYYEVLYSGKRDKWPPAAHMAGNKEETFAMVPHELHRKQRARNMPLMGKRAVLDSVPMLTYQLCKLKAVFVAAAQSGDALDLGVTFLAFTTDVVGRHFFQQSLGMQDDIVEARQWKTATHNMATSTPFIKQFPWIVNSVLRIPSRILKALAPADMAPFLGFHTGMQDRAKVFLDTVQRESREPQGTEEQHPEVDGTEKRNRSATLFHSIYKSNAPPEERSFTRLFHEGVNIIAAGSETTARLLTRVMYELTANPNAFIKARREVNEAADRTNKLVDGLTLVELERLPWLTAAIKESLRVAAIMSSRLPLCPHEPLQYRRWSIPAMTSVSLTPYDVLHDPTIFPEPDIFRPERWLKIASDSTMKLHTDLERYFVAFGKGPRMCQGVDIACAEMYLAISMLVVNFDFKLFDVIKERDIDYAADCFLGEVRTGSPGVRVTVKQLAAAG